MDLITRYFPGISPKQSEQFARLPLLYQQWNEHINVISRKDVDNLYERHVLHSLGIAMVMDFHPGVDVLDVGTGGGFPGIPLAIMYPETNFICADSIGKKINVVQSVAQELGLENVTAIHERAEKVKQKFDFVVSRAVTRIKPFTMWVRNSFKNENRHPLPNGILYLKGGDLSEELEEYAFDYEIIPLSKFFEEEFFETKKVLYVPMNPPEN